MYMIRRGCMGGVNWALIIINKYGILQPKIKFVDLFVKKGNKLKFNSFIRNKKHLLCIMIAPVTPRPCVWFSGCAELF